MIEINNRADVTQIRLSRELDGKPLYWVAAHLVDGLLIDTGCDYTAAELVAFLKGKKLDLVVNTHFHEDHVGGNALIRKQFQVAIYAPPESILIIGRKPFLYPYQEMVWGYPAPSTAKPIPPSIRTDHHTFDVLATPGHSVGHIVLLEKEKGWCFSGDIFARENPKFIRPEEDMGATIHSLAQILAAMPPQFTLFTSLGRIVENGREALKENIRYLQELAAKAQELHKQGRSVEEIIQDIFGGEHLFAQMTNGQYTTENLVRSVMKIPV
jgi:glyoxylase-like metal-dependent hydrolase (beta-lactamase superfamily II)